jgi:hypothetical protein
VAGAAIYGADGPATVFVGGAVISAGFVVAAMLTGRGRMPGK